MAFWRISQGMAPRNGWRRLAPLSTSCPFSTARALPPTLKEAQHIASAENEEEAAPAALDVHRETDSFVLSDAPHTLSETRVLPNGAEEIAEVFGRLPAFVPVSDQFVCRSDLLNLMKSLTDPVVAQSTQAMSSLGDQFASEWKSLEYKVSCLESEFREQGPFSHADPVGDSEFPPFDDDGLPALPPFYRDDFPSCDDELPPIAEEDRFLTGEMACARLTGLSQQHLNHVVGFVLGLSPVK